MHSATQLAIQPKNNAQIHTHTHTHTQHVVVHKVICSWQDKEISFNRICDALETIEAALTHTRVTTQP